MGGVAKCQICRKVVVRGVYCTCDPMVGWHKHCMAKQVKANVETVCKKCKSTVHTDQGMAGTQQMSRKKKGTEEEEMDDGTQGVEKDAEAGTDEEEREATEDDEAGGGSSKDEEKTNRRGRRRVNVESDSD